MQYSELKLFPLDAALFEASPSKAKRHNSTLHISSTFSQLLYRGASSVRTQSPRLSKSKVDKFVLKLPEHILDSYRSVVACADALSNSIPRLVAQVDKLRTEESYSSSNTAYLRLFAVISRKVKKLLKVVDNYDHISEEKKPVRANKFFASKLVKDVKLFSNDVFLNKSDALDNLVENQTSNTSTSEDQQFETHYPDLSENSLFFNTPIKSAVPVTVTNLASPTGKRDTSSHFSDYSPEYSRSYSPVKNVNYFNIICRLAKINFIDREQSTNLKHCVVRNNKKVIEALSAYNRNEDLQILVSNLGNILNDSFNVKT